MDRAPCLAGGGLCVVFPDLHLLLGLSRGVFTNMTFLAPLSFALQLLLVLIRHAEVHVGGPGQVSDKGEGKNMR